MSEVTDQQREKAREIARGHTYLGTGDAGDVVHFDDLVDAIALALAAEVQEAYARGRREAVEYLALELEARGVFSANYIRALAAGEKA